MIRKYFKQKTEGIAWGKQNEKCLISDNRKPNKLIEKRYCMECGVWKLQKDQGARDISNSFRKKFIVQRILVSRNELRSLGLWHYYSRVIKGEKKLGDETVLS